MNDKINLTEAEWMVMECLWENASMSGREVTEEMEIRMGWNRSTTLTLLRRLVAKGATGEDTRDGKKVFQPILKREDAVLQETEDFLGRLYKGSLSLLVSSFTKKQSLKKEEIEELYAILKELEEEKND
ncbi:MAG: BlaI/MecI/CopY family transcriptional regulator [Lachnospiraceae bacterium]|nr:BlaI/MecI/CopY family transcriptional regulator [Lachnospiraceae bacterium]